MKYCELFLRFPEFKDKWEQLENICKTVGRKENVWYATNMEVIDYISAFKELRRSVKGDIVYNPTNIDVYVSVGNKDILLKKVKTMVIE